MKTRLINLAGLTTNLLALTILFVAIAYAQSGQMGFSSVVADKNSTGSITNASSNVIEDLSQNWRTNTWSGYFIRILDKNGSQQIRKIIGNTTKTITVAPEFSAIPNSNSNYEIRRGYKESMKELKLKLYVQYNDGNRTGGKLDGYSCQIKASDSSAIEFVSVEQGSGLGNAWKPSYYAPTGEGKINWLVIRLSESQPLASGLYHIATVTYNILKSESDKSISFFISNCPDGDLPIASTEDSHFLFFDTTSNNSFSGREEIFVLNSNGYNSFAMENSTSLGSINSYPNPFNPSTTLRYELTEYSEVHLLIYDITGRLVSELVNSNQYEGMHSIAWEPNNASSGTYFARLSIQGSVSKQKDVKTLKLAYTK